MNNSIDISSNNKAKNHETKKILTLIILIAVLMVTTTGATYAYLQITATATNNITGTVATAGLNFQLSNSASATSGIPALTLPTTVDSVNYTTKPMIPQYGYRNSTNIIQKAVTGVIPSGKTNRAACVDDNQNVICRVYSFTVRNTSTAAIRVSGRIYFTGAPTNLRWALMDNSGTVTVTGTTPATNFRTPMTGTSTNSSDCTATYSKTGETANNCWFEYDQYLSAGNTTASAPAGSYKQYWIVFWINETGAVQTDSGQWFATVAFTSSNGTGITSTIVS